MDSSVLSDVLKNLQSLCGANGAIFGYAAQQKYKDKKIKNEGQSLPPFKSH